MTKPRKKTREELIAEVEENKIPGWLNCYWQIEMIMKSMRSILTPSITLDIILNRNNVIF